MDHEDRIIRVQDSYSLGAFSVPLQILAAEMMRHQEWKVVSRIRLFHDILHNLARPSSSIPESTDWLYWYAILHDELSQWSSSLLHHYEDIRSVLHTLFFIPFIYPFPSFEIRYQAFLHILQSLPTMIRLDMVFAWLEKEQLSQDHQVKLLKACMIPASDSNMEGILVRMTTFFQKNQLHQVSDRSLPVVLRSIRSTRSYKHLELFNDMEENREIVG